MSGPPRDPWFFLAERTTARIGRGRTGGSLPTREVLAFDLAHAQARDAVHARFDRVALAKALAGLDLVTLDVESEAAGRQAYLRRPDAGRRLSAASAERLSAAAGPGCDLAIMIGGGLSAVAVQACAADLIAAFLPGPRRMGLTIGPIVLAEGARVALGDAVGAALKARLSIVLIGERPGLSAVDSLGVYLTFDPKPGRNDAERNCISNIRSGGLSPSHAAAKLNWLIGAAFQRGLTGVALKDESDAVLQGADVHKKL
jgi:ethanolamine ammonia-lyase small subunit